jgi:DNA replication licensing factor MCM5
MRGQAHKIDSAESSAIPITVRQLEAIIRIAEALAKLTLSPLAMYNIFVIIVIFRISHVDEAVRLFRVSTMQAVLAGHSMEGMTRPDLLGQIEQVEKAIRSRLPIGSNVPYRQLLEEMVGSKGFPEHAVIRTIDAMCRQERLIWRNQRLLRQQ